MICWKASCCTPSKAKHAFGAPTLAQITELKKIYGLDLTAADSHQLVETERIARNGISARATAKRPAAATKRGRNR